MDLQARGPGLDLVPGRTHDGIRLVADRLDHQALVQADRVGVPHARAGAVDQGQRTVLEHGLVDGPLQGALSRVRAVHADEDASRRDLSGFHGSTLGR